MRKIQMIKRSTKAILLALAVSASALQASVVLDTNFSVDGDLQGWRNDFNDTVQPSMTVANGYLTTNQGTGSRGISHFFDNNQAISLGVGESLSLSFDLRWNAAPTATFLWGILSYDQAHPNGIGNTKGYYGRIDIPASNVTNDLRQANGNGTTTVITSNPLPSSQTTVMNQWYHLELTLTRTASGLVFTTVFNGETASATLQTGLEFYDFNSIYLGTSGSQPPRFSIDNVMVTYNAIPEATSSLLAGVGVLVIGFGLMRRVA